MPELGPIIATVLRSLIAYLLGNAAAANNDSLITQVATGIGTAIVAGFGIRNAIINANEKAEKSKELEIVKSEKSGP